MASIYNTPRKPVLLVVRDAILLLSMEDAVQMWYLPNVVDKARNPNNSIH